MHLSHRRRPSKSLTERFAQPPSRQSRSFKMPSNLWFLSPCVALNESGQPIDFSHVDVCQLSNDAMDNFDDAELDQYLPLHVHSSSLALSANNTQGTGLSGSNQRLGESLASSSNSCTSATATGGGSSQLPSSGASPTAIAWINKYYNTSSPTLCTRGSDNSHHLQQDSKINNNGNMFHQQDSSSSILVPAVTVANVTNATGVSNMYAFTSRSSIIDDNGNKFHELQPATSLLHNSHQNPIASVGGGTETSHRSLSSFASGAPLTMSPPSLTSSQTGNHATLFYGSAQCSYDQRSASFYSTDGWTNFV